ncbi:MAG: sortase [Actinomycetota bacterium]|nr:sortase [Actinomycetota bacterium]
MFIGGAAFVAYPFYTDYLAGKQQQTLAVALKSEAARRQFEDNEVPDSSPLTRLVIPRLQVDTVVVEGISDEALDTGAGHYPDSPLPGQPGNVAIAGHRNTFGKPFADLDKLRPGDKVILETPVGRHVYQMVEPFEGHGNPWVTTPGDTSVLAPTSESVLTLTTCHPKGSAKERLIARLKLVESSSGPALAAA